MNAPISFPPPAISDGGQFDGLRLKLLDVFYSLDASLEDWLRDLNLNRANASTGCRIDTLCTAVFPPNVASKVQADYLSSLSSALADVIEVRNLVVHSRASFGYVGDQPTVFLRPIGFRHKKHDGFVHFDVEEVEHAIKEASSVAAKISGWRKQRDTKSSQSINPPSSPPPPSPDAATGP